MLGVTLLSLLVWQHHLFVSGINSDLRPFYMLSTELISIPTGFTFLCGLMTLWRGRIRFTVPMLFCLAWFFNFLIGGLSGVFLSDVPSDVTTHGSFFSMAHFHYTIMGGLIFTFFAAIYYWVPKMTGFELNERLGKIHFWSMFLAFNSTFAPLFAVGFLGQPRRVVTYPQHLQFLNDWVSVSAFVLGLSMLVFLCNFVYSLVFARVPAGQQPVGLAVARVAAALARAGPQLRPDPGDHGRSRTTTAAPASRSALPHPLPRRRRVDVTELAQPATDYEVVEREPPEQLGRNLNSAGHLLASATRVLLPRVRLRLLLPALAEQRRALASEGRRSVAGARRAGHGGERRAPRCSSGWASPTTAPTAGRPGGSRARSRSCSGSPRVVLQVVEWTTNGFGPADGGYASVFFGWTAFYVLFLVGALFWLETTWRRRSATAAGRRSPGTVAPGEARATPTAPGDDIRDPLSLVRAELERSQFYWGFLAGVGVLAWILLYLA